MPRARGTRRPIPRPAGPILPIDPSARPMVKATREIVRQRIEVVMRLRLRGASATDVIAYAQVYDPETGRPWNLSFGAICAYCRKAEAMMKTYREDNREQLLNKHLGMRQELYRECWDAGQRETCLAIAKDAAHLQGLYPSDKGLGTGAAATTQNVQILVDLRGLPGQAREQALAGGASVDPRQLEGIDPDELLRLHRAALQVTYTPTSP